MPNDCRIDGMSFETQETLDDSLDGLLLDCKEETKVSGECYRHKTGCAITPMVR